MPPRILQVASGLPRWGGTEKYVLDLSLALSKRGNEVTVGCPAGSVLQRKAIECGLQTGEMELRTPYQWERIASFVRKFSGNYDVIHTHSTLDSVIPAIAGRLASVPATVMTRHMPHPFASTFNAFICSPVLYDRVIAVSEYVRNVLVDSGGNKNSIETVRNGLDLSEETTVSREKLRNYLSIPLDDIVIAAAGRIVPGKGFDVLLRAIKRVVAESGPSLTCVIAGDGKGLEGLRHLLSVLELEHCVRLPGFLSDSSQLWHTADIAVVPSVEPESFSFAALEALGAGSPVIASKIGALPELLSAESAILVEPGDVDGLALAMRRLTSSAELRKRMGYAARQRAMKFTMEANVLAVERIYLQLTTRR